MEIFWVFILVFFIPWLGGFAHSLVIVFLCGWVGLCAFLEASPVKLSTLFLSLIITTKIHI